MITFDHFKQIELKVAQVIDCKKVEGADKLLQIEIDLGEERRTIVAGVAKWYNVDEMIGKKIIVVVNLQPAKIRGIESNGMLLAAQSGNSLSLITVDKDIAAGAKIG